MTPEQAMEQLFLGGCKKGDQIRTELTVSDGPYHTNPAVSVVYVTDSTDKLFRVEVREV